MVPAVRNLDRHLALWLAIVSVSAGVAMMAAPLYLPRLPAGLFFWGGILVFCVGLAVTLTLLVRGRQSAELRDQKPMIGPILLMVLGAMVFGGGAIWFYLRLPDPPPAAISPSVVLQGQAGGGAKVGGDGAAFGGEGGHAGPHGKAGEGGSAEVGGSGFAGGGPGGSVGEEDVWKPPAKSGYEVYCRQMGLPIDPSLRQFGRGGAMSGYEPRLRAVEQLRAEYFKETSTLPRSFFEDIGAVPVEYLNDKLLTHGADWRVRVIDDEYEFFVPRA